MQNIISIFLGKRIVEAVLTWYDCSIGLRCLTFWSNRSESRELLSVKPRPPMAVSFSLKIWETLIKITRNSVVAKPTYFLSISYLCCQYVWKSENAATMSWTFSPNWLNNSTVRTWPFSPFEGSGSLGLSNASEQSNEPTFVPLLPSISEHYSTY